MTDRFHKRQKGVGRASSLCLSWTCSSRGWLKALHRTRWTVIGRERRWMMTKRRLRRQSHLSLCDKPSTNSRWCTWRESLAKIKSNGRSLQKGKLSNKVRLIPSANSRCLKSSSWSQPSATYRRRIWFGNWTSKSVWKWWMSARTLSNKCQSSRWPIIRISFARWTFPKTNSSTFPKKPSETCSSWKWSTYPPIN